MIDAEQRPLLLIEDNPMDVDLTIRAFKKSNVKNPVEIARDGAEALECITRYEAGEPAPIVILLDLQLPKVSGLEVLKALKSNDKTASIPVVVLTTSSEDRDINTAYKLGANSYIVKPVDFDKFVTVAQHIEIYWNSINQAPR